MFCLDPNAILAWPGLGAGVPRFSAVRRCGPGSGPAPPEQEMRFFCGSPEVCPSANE